MPFSLFLIMKTMAILENEGNKKNKYIKTKII